MGTTYSGPDLNRGWRVLGLRAQKSKGPKFFFYSCPKKKKIFYIFWPCNWSDRKRGHLTTDSPPSSPTTSVTDKPASHSRAKPPWAIANPSAHHTKPQPPPKPRQGVASPLPSINIESLTRSSDDPRRHRCKAETMTTTPNLAQNQQIWNLRSSMNQILARDWKDIGNPIRQQTKRRPSPNSCQGKAATGRGGVYSRRLATVFFFFICRLHMFVRLWKVQ